MTEQNQDAHEYVDAAVNACKRRLELLADAYRRGVHTPIEFVRLWDEIIAETEQAWDIKLDMPAA
jgi:hypothetical protein